MPGWATESRAHVISVHGYAQFQALLLAWASWGLHPEQTDGALQMVRSTFALSQETLRRGADSIERDGGTNIDSDIEAYQSLLDELTDAALVAHQPPDETVDGLFLLLGQTLAEFDPAYQAGGGAKADPLLQTLLGILGDTLAGDFVQDPHLAAIVLRTLLGLIPYVDQAMDLQDILGGLYHLTWKAEIDSPAIWIGIVLTLLGCIPELGSVLKGVGKGGMVLVKDLARRGAGALQLDKLFELLTDGAKRLDLDGKLAAALQQWSEVRAGFDLAAVSGVVGKAVEDLLTRVEVGALRAYRLAAELSEEAAKKFQQVAAHAQKAREAAAARVAEGVEQARKGIDEVVRFVKEEIGVRQLKDTLGEESFDKLVQRLGQDAVRTLSGELDADMIGLLARKFDHADMLKLDPAKVARALSGLSGAPLEAFRVLSPEQMTEFLQRDELILEAFRKMEPEEQAELFEKIRTIDRVFSSPNKGSRAGHAVTEHGPHIPDEYLYERAQRLNIEVSRWSSFEAMEAAIAEARAKVTDPAYWLSQRGHQELDMFKGDFWKDYDAGKITIERALASPWSYPKYFKGALSKFNPIYAGTMANAGQHFKPEGGEPTLANAFKIVFQWDTTGKLQVLTGYPT